MMLFCNFSPKKAVSVDPLILIMLISLGLKPADYFELSGMVNSIFSMVVLFVKTWSQFVKRIKL